MSAEEAVRRTLAQYCQLVDDGRFEEWSQLFATDGTFSVMGRTHKGHDELKAFIGAALKPGAGKHVTINSIIDVNGDEARASSDFVYVAPTEGGVGISQVGRYTDRLVRQDGRWVFAERSVTLGLTP